MAIKAEDFRWSATSEGEWLYIKYPTPRDFLATLEPGKEYDVDIKPHRQKRSLDANALYWMLIGKLSQKLDLPADALYRIHIRDMSVYELVCIKEEAVNKYDRLWSNGHMGRFTDIMGPTADHPGYVWVRTYYGSSDFDTKQMSRLIDNCIEDCKTQGVEVPPPPQIRSLLDEWEAKR